MVVIDTVGDIIAGPTPGPAPGPGPVTPEPVPNKPPRYPPTDPENEESDDDCYLVTAQVPSPKGARCWYCIYFCPKGHVRSAIDRYQPDGCHKNAKQVEGWPPSTKVAEDDFRDGRSLCEINADLRPLPIYGPYQ